MESKITILGFGCGEEGEITLRTMEALRNADKVFIRTARHPAASILERESIDYESFDNLYDNAQDHEGLYLEIARQVLSCPAGKVAYVVPGNPFFAEKSVQLILSLGQGRDIEAVPSVSFVDGVYSATRKDAIEGFKLLDALSLDTQAPDTTCMNIICQVYDKATACDVKTALMKYYSDETPVLLVNAAGTASEDIVPCLLHEIDTKCEISHLTSLVIPKAGIGLTLGSFTTLRTIFEVLRGDGGCPWDREQTVQSLVPYIIEEAYELVGAIELSDEGAILEELGDLLLQVMLASQIKSDEGSFSIDEVIYVLSDKMLRRHPHVFAGEEASEINALWEHIKDSEHGVAKPAERAMAVSDRLPSLMYAQKVMSRASLAGTIGERLKALQKQVSALDEESLAAWLPLAMLELANLSGMCGLDAEMDLRNAVKLFLKQLNQDNI
ncbi:MAG: MazG family protein [Eubacteriaceae bacterium]|nr:MazG family protein [Eubacteriaceae bacterium]